jgi:glycerate kinase
VLAVPDRFPGSASAAEVAEAVERAAAGAGWDCDRAPVSDGGAGFLDAMGGRPRRTLVRGPLGEAVTAEWRLLGSIAVIETAQAVGLELAGGPEWNDPVRASTAGVGDLIVAAVAARARRVIVGMGGSATTDGGLGCVNALRPHSRLAGVELTVACDVDTRFVDAADRFAPQKGASPAQVELLRRRLERLAQVYEADYGTDVRGIRGSGAAGGLAGGLAAMGADLVPGFALVAEAVDLAERVAAADLVVTGEGLLDEDSFDGKPVGGVVELAEKAGVPVLVVVGQAWPPPAGRRAGPVGALERARRSVVSLVDRFGPDRAGRDVVGCVEQVASEHLAAAGAE